MGKPHASATGVAPASPQVSAGPKRGLVLLLLAAALIVPTIFWRQVWWGMPLPDDELSERLSDPQNVRHVQHALEELSKRIEEDPDTARPFYRLVISLSDHSEPLIRSAVAWLMGEDNSYEPFKESLHRLAEDDAPVVRYNAAVALARFADGSGRAVLREMLRPYVIKAAWDGDSEQGVVADALLPNDPVTYLTRIALVELEGQDHRVQLAPLGGYLTEMRIRSGQRIQRGDEIAAIAPNRDQVRAALRALYLVGGTGDLEDVERYIEPGGHLAASASQQARATAGAIRQREGSN